MKKIFFFLLFMTSLMISSQLFGMSKVIRTLNPSKKQKEKNLTSQIEYERAVARGEKQDPLRQIANFKFKNFFKKNKEPEGAPDQYNPITELEKTLETYNQQEGKSTSKKGFFALWSTPAPTKTASESTNDGSKENDLNQFKVTDDKEEAHLRRLTLERLSKEKLEEYVKKVEKFEPRKDESNANSTEQKSIPEKQKSTPEKQKEILTKEIDNMSKEEIDIFSKAFFGSKDGTKLEKKQAIKELLSNQEGWKDKNTKQLIKGINAYKEMVRREQYREVFKKHDRIKLPFKVLLSTIPLFAYLGLKALFNTATLQSDISKNAQNNASKDINLSIFNKKMLEKTNQENQKALGDTALQIHPFAQKASDLEYAGRTLTEDEIKTISIISHRQDILKNELMKLENNPDQLSEKMLTQETDELEKSIAFLNQQLFMYELNIRYTPVIKEDGPISQALDQNKEVSQLLETKLERLNSRISSENIMQAIALESGKIEQEAAIKKEHELALLKGQVANINAELTYLNLRMRAEREIIDSTPTENVDLPEWEKQLLARKETIMKAMREAITKDGTILRDTREPYEMSRDRTTAVLLNFEPPYKERTMAKQKSEQSEDMQETPQQQNKQLNQKVVKEKSQKAAEKTKKIVSDVAGDLSTVSMFM